MTSLESLLPNREYLQSWAEAPLDGQGAIISAKLEVPRVLYGYDSAVRAVLRTYGLPAEEISRSWFRDKTRYRGEFEHGMYDWTVTRQGLLLPLPRGKERVEIWAVTESNNLTPLRNLLGALNEYVTFIEGIVGQT